MKEFSNIEDISKYLSSSKFFNSNLFNFFIDLLDSSHLHALFNMEIFSSLHIVIFSTNVGINISRDTYNEILGNLGPSTNPKNIKKLHMYTVQHINIIIQ